MLLTSTNIGIVETPSEILLIEFSARCRVHVLISQLAVMFMCWLSSQLAVVFMCRWKSVSDLYVSSESQSYLRSLMALLWICWAAVLANSVEMKYCHPRSEEKNLLVKYNQVRSDMKNISAKSCTCQVYYLLRQFDVSAEIHDISDEPLAVMLLRPIRMHHKLCISINIIDHVTASSPTIWPSNVDFTQWHELLLLVYRKFS